MTVEERLEKLERQNRRLIGSLISFVAIMAVVGCLGVSNQDSIPDVVKARAFHVVGKDGTNLVKLEDSMGDGTSRAGTVTTYDSNGEQLVQIGMTTTGIGRVAILKSLSHSTSRRQRWSNLAFDVSTASRQFRRIARTGSVRR